MPDKDKVIKAFEECICKNHKYCTECYQEGPGLGIICRNSVCFDVFALLKEQEAAYQGAEELLRQKTILFDDAIKRLKAQEAVEPIRQTEQTEWTVCGNCREHIISKWVFCPYCGRAVKWK